MKIKEWFQKARNKRKVVLICALVIVAAISVGGTTAYFTAESTASNVITTGDIKIQVNETMLTEEGIEVPFEDQFNVVPGDDVSKIVRVENICENTCWVRVQVEKEIELAPGKEGEPDPSLITLNFNKRAWKKVGDWYYCLAPLAPEDVSEVLFDTVSFDPLMGNLYQKSQTFITVTAQGVQKVHNGDTVFEAVGWPED